MFVTPVAIFDANQQAPAPVDTAAQWALLKADDGTLLGTIMGCPLPVHMVIMDEVDGGTDQIGVGDLKTATNAPAFQQTSETLDLDVVNIAALTQALQASSDVPWQVGNESSALLSICAINDAPGGLQQLSGKANATIDGYEVKTSTSSDIQWTVFGTGGGSKTSIASFRHFIAATTRADLVVALSRNDQDADECCINTNLGDGVITTSLGESLSNNADFGVGKIRSNARASHHGMEVLWKGANAEFINWTKTPREAVDALLDFLGLGIFQDIP